MDAFKRMDQRILKMAYLSRAGNYLPLPLLIFMGDGPFWLLLLGVCTVIGIFMGMISFLKLSLLIMMGFALAQLAFIPCKLFVKRRRPYADAAMQRVLGIVIENRDPGHGSREMESFPSGHLYWTTMCVVFISHQFGIAGIIVTGWMVPMMGYLRLYLGVHFPSDVLAGFLMGALTASLALVMLPMIFSAHQDMARFGWYNWCYLFFIGVFIMGGYYSWLKRV